jgi:dinuclear metal center YbgI/SA1388 family protein
MATRGDIVAFLDEYLSIRSIEDSSRNGLQVEGAAEVAAVGLAVDSSLQAYRAAADAGCRMLLVHHGLIWGGLTSITGWVHHQVKYLMDHDISLYAAHLPLDMHAEVGNNAVLGRMLGLSEVKPFGLYKGNLIGVEGTLPKPLGAEALAAHLAELLGGPRQVLPFGRAANRRVGIVSGGGSDCIHEAVDKGIDCVVTGEAAHWNHHAALEGSLNMVYCGHYHTEQVGVKALGEVLKAKFGVKTVFLDIPTLV